MYGNYGFWAWFRYWYIDTCDQVTLMLIDKSYYDYDYEPVPPKPRKVDVNKAREKFRGFFGQTKFHNALTQPQGADNEETELERAERLQREASERYKAIR